MLWPGQASAATISIEPLRQEIELAPGQTIAKSLIVFNASANAETVNVDATSFNTVDKHYDYAFGNPPDLSGWIQLIENQAAIPPYSQHIFNYNVAVPNNAEPGGAYIAVFASTRDPVAALDRSTTVVERIGSLIYLTVSGQETKRGSLLSYATPKISFSRSNTWDLQVQNKGNTHFDSQITIRVRQWFGRTVASSTADHLILPGTIREMNGQYRLGRLPNLYHIQVAVGLGDNPAARTNRWLLYLPPLPSLVTLGLFSLIVGLMTRKLRRGRLKRSSG